MFHSPFKGTIPNDIKPPSLDSTFKCFSTSQNTHDLEGPSIYMQIDSQTFDHFHFINFMHYIKSISSFYFIHGLKVIVCFPPS